MDELFLPLASRVFCIIEEPASGTDDAVMKGDVRRSFLTFLVSLFNFELYDILISPRNQTHANAVFMFIVQQARDCTNVQVSHSFSLLFII
jgi:exportin-T